MTLSNFLCFLSVSLASSASAQTYEKQCDPKDSTSCVLPLVEGESAPFTGQLMTFRRAAKLAVMSGQCSARIKLATEETTEVLELQINLQKSLRANDAEVWKLKEDLFRKRIDAVEAISSRHWYEHPVVWAIVGAGVMTGAFYVSVATVNHSAR